MGDIGKFQMINDPGIYSPISIKKSPIHGWGVFSEGIIPLGAVIEISPGLVIHENLIKVAYYMMRSEGMSEDSLKIDQYVFSWGDSQVFLPLGWAGLYNHSDSPSARMHQSKKDSTVKVISLREIHPGEEITISYGEGWWQNRNLKKQ